MKLYNVYCVHWGDKYSRDSVTRLKDSVESNTTLDIKFWCYTDQPKEDYDIPVKYSYLKGVWHKLALFEFTGPSVYFDLDLDIENNIDFLFRDFDGFTLLNAEKWKDYNFEDELEQFRFRLNNDTKLNSSFMRWQDNKIVFEKFIKEPNTYTRIYKGIDRFIYNEGVEYKLLDSVYIPHWKIKSDLWNNQYWVPALIRDVG